MENAQKTPDNNRPSAPERGPEHDLLDVFVGKWHAEGLSYGEGQSKEDPKGTAVKWVSDETYAWFEGKFFLVHHWDALTGDHPFKRMSIIGYDDAKGAYFVSTFENHGFHPVYELSVRDNTWTFSGEAQRATVVVSDDKNTMTFTWEWKNDGVNWLPLCDRKAVRVE